MLTLLSFLLCNNDSASVVTYHFKSREQRAVPGGPVLEKYHFNIQSETALRYQINTAKNKNSSD